MKETEKEIDIPEGDELERAMAGVYRLYQHNIRRTDELIYRITRGARDGVPEEELLNMAMEALERCAVSPEEI